MDLETIRRNYENLDDNKLIKLATEDINSLRKEVIPILEEELAKRKISIKDEEVSTRYVNPEEFQKPIDKKSEFPGKEIEEVMNIFELPNILKSGKIYYIKKAILFIISTILSAIFVLLFKPLLGGEVKMIISIIIVSILILIVLKYLGVGKLAEIKPDKVILSKYPNIKLEIFRILILALATFNLLKKIEVDDKNILNIYQKDDLEDYGFYIDIYDDLSKKTNSYKVLLEFLSDYDKKQVVEVIKLKIEKS